MDCTLSVRVWGQVERLFEPHAFNLNSLDSDCQHDGTGQCWPNLHLVQLRVLAELMILHSLCLRTTTCTSSRRFVYLLRPFWNAFSSRIFMVRLLSLYRTWTLDASGGRCYNRLLSQRYKQRSDASASLTMKSGFREASDLVTSVVHPDNLDAAV